MNLRKVAAHATIVGALGFTALGLGVGTASADNGSDEPQFDQVQYEEPPVYVPPADFDAPPVYYPPADFDPPPVFVPRPDYDAPPVYYPPPEENETPFFCFPFVVCQG